MRTQDPSPVFRSATSQQVPYPGFGRIAREPEEILLLCYYDPAGISTVIETVAYMQASSRYSVSVFNFFDHRLDGGFLRLHPRLDLSRFDVVIIHNTVAYNPDNVRSLDELIATKLQGYEGVKVLMKQDENFRFRALAQYMGEIQFDLVLTCLPLEAVPLVYPPQIAGSPRFERMLTGYVTPTLRSHRSRESARRIDIGYRGSIQPLTFGRLAYEKRKIGRDVAAKLAARSDLVLDISSRWEDRLGGDAWFAFLGNCKATLGAESGASIFDLDGDLEQRCALLEQRHADLAEDERAEAVLQGLSDLEGNVHYNQLSPRHFEAIACGSIQLLYPGAYSGLLIAGQHYFELARDCSNLDEAVDLILDERRRAEMAACAYEEVVLEPRNWIETFVERLDNLVESELQRKGRRRRPLASGADGLHAVLLGAQSSAEPLAGGATAAWNIHRLVAVPRLGRALSAEAGPLGLEIHVLSQADPVGGLPPWSEWEGAAADARAVLAELQRLSTLADDELCAFVGVPLRVETSGRFRESLAHIHSCSLALLRGLLSCRGMHALVCSDAAGLIAAAAAKGLLGTRLLLDRSALKLSGDLSEGEVQFWGEMLSRLGAHADEGPDMMNASQAQPFRVFVPREPRYYLTVRTPEGDSAQAPGDAASERKSAIGPGPLRRVWRRLPVSWRQNLRAVLRRVD